MKLLFVVLTVVFFPFVSAMAYLEVGDADDAKATPMEQTTSFYKIHNATDMSVKKLKKINEAYMRNPQLSETMSIDELERVVITDSQESRQYYYLQDLLKQVKKELAQKNNLNNKKDGNFYVQLTNIALQSPKRDAEAIAQLKAKYRR
jgi:hypothetical protein